jgi:hypothetical protein
MSKREIVESPWEQGAEESIAYRLPTTPWGGSPSSPVVKLYEGENLTDVSATKLSGAASITGDFIDTPFVQSLTAVLIYRLEIKFMTGGRTEEAWGEIYCRR